MLLEQDLHGAYLTCLNCGYVLEERLVEPQAPSAAAWWRAQ
jgi:hypothetical protein